MNTRPHTIRSTALVFLLLSAIASVVRNDGRSFVRVDFSPAYKPTRVEVLVSERPDYFACFKQVCASLLPPIAPHAQPSYNRHLLAYYNALVALRLRDMRSADLPCSVFIAQLLRSHHWHRSFNAPPASIV